MVRWHKSNLHLCHVHSARYTYSTGTNTRHTGPALIGALANRDGTQDINYQRETMRENASTKSLPSLKGAD